MSPSKKLIITTGDIDGVGLEVSAKALREIGSKPGLNYFLYISKKTNKKYFLQNINLLLENFNLLFFSTLSEALLSCHQIVTKKATLYIIESDLHPAQWVEEASLACINKLASGLVTAPLSKPAIMDSGLKDLGHTDILKRLCKVKTANMAFVGSHFNVVLASDHIPVANIEKSLTKNTLSTAIKNADSLRKMLPKPLSKRPIAILGLNPHAGDKKLIGLFENKILSPMITNFRKKGFHLSNPLVPDVAFQPQNQGKYSVYISMYHDQGLIPFKMAHGFAGAHLTLGLPIWRTSVDHGTAKDIFGLSIANPTSMIEAIQWSIRLTKEVL
jgi:4-hydroxythreonine-4-phosphate dehydrogenase